MIKSALFFILIFTSLDTFCQKKEQSEIIIRQGYGDVMILDFWVDSTKDTLHISPNSTIKYIKIGDQIWEIKRSTTMEKIDPEPVSPYNRFILPENAWDYKDYKFK